MLVTSKTPHHRLTAEPLLQGEAFRYGVLFITIRATNFHLSVWKYNIAVNLKPHKSIDFYAVFLYNDRCIIMH